MFSFQYGHNRPEFGCNTADRFDTMKKLINWLETVDYKQPIFWLYGDPKCGKTVFAQHIFTALRDEIAVASTFRFGGRTSQKMLGEAFIANLIIDVGHYLGSPFLKALLEVTSVSQKFAHDGFLGQRALEDQLLDLFIPAFNRITRKKPLLVMIDGIEQCETDALNNIFGAIAIAIRQLPICFIISSNVTPEVEKFLGPDGKLKSCVVSAAVPSVMVTLEADTTPTRINDADDPGRTPTAASFASQQADIATPTGSPTDSFFSALEYEE
ncbi:hypothetical protein FA15DRAFT_500038 [Coprinopsis marcescibilis]|uniref:Nephrocystin 3-like N-terminal domain-containing protein n=1 Tax=Coprinopsis marcescibilis TaxID=230819 RepID=A0A5C3KQI3_COPMA|nr:hypothetical protein FA15DRAFT_500038 [Coprinopsis marcescibilis]